MWAADFGDLVFSGCGFLGSFQVSRPGSGGSSLFRLILFASALRDCSGSSLCPRDDPGLLLLREATRRMDFQLRQPALPEGSRADS
jgi:hypothetical protein